MLTTYVSVWISLDIFAYKHSTLSKENLRNLLLEPSKIVKTTLIGKHKPH